MEHYMERAAGIEPVYRAWQARELTIVLRPQVWSGITDLNRHHLLGGQKYYHYTNPAGCIAWAINSLDELCSILTGTLSNASLTATFDPGSSTCLFFMR